MFVLVYKKMISRDDINVLFIAFQVLQRLSDRLPLRYCTDAEEVKDVAKKNRRYKIILICKADDLQQLAYLISKRCFDDIWTLGQYSGLNETSRPIRSIQGDERDLTYCVIYETIQYGNAREIDLRGMEDNHQLAQELSLKIQYLYDMLRNYI